MPMILASVDQPFPNMPVSFEFMALAGPPVRANGPGIVGPTQSYEGFIKVRLGHSVGRSVIIPDQLVIRNAGWQFFQPSFFGPPFIGFDVEPGLHSARFSLDIGGPRETEPRRVQVTVRSDGLKRSYVDGSQVYACSIDGPPLLSPFAAGKCQPLDEGHFALRLFHHTQPHNAGLIKNSGELRSSAWNLAGVRELENVAYAYLTSLPQIQGSADLARIAMSHEGQIYFQTTSVRTVEQVVALQVYRDSTKNRTAPLKFLLPWDLISPPHLLLHQPLNDFAYYEVVGPEIYRVSMQPGQHLNIHGDNLVADEARRKIFDYIILGDASDPDGVIAPYDEERTDMIMHCQRLGIEENIFDFWRRNANTNQIAGRQFETIRLNNKGNMAI